MQVYKDPKKKKVKLLISVKLMSRNQLIVSLGLLHLILQWCVWAASQARINIIVTWLRHIFL